MNCCRAPNGIDEIFDERMARADARRYLRRGLPVRARRLIAGIRNALPLQDATTLEVGGGAGGVTIELVRAGVREAAIIDASPAYVEEARRVVSECGVGDRVTVRQADYADESLGDTVDVVILDRVICCFPDWQALLDPATKQAARALGLTYPRDAGWTSLFIRAANLGMRITRRTFRLQHHPPAAILSFLENAGFHPRVTGHRGLWEVVVATRTQTRVL